MAKSKRSLPSIFFYVLPLVLNIVFFRMPRLAFRDAGDVVLGGRRVAVVRGSWYLLLALPFIFLPLVLPTPSTLGLASLVI